MNLASYKTTQPDKIMQLLYCLQDSVKLASELCEMTGLKQRQIFCENYLHPALNKNLIERTISNIPNSRSLAYRLKNKKHPGI